MIRQYVAKARAVPDGWYASIPELDVEFTAKCGRDEFVGHARSAVAAALGKPVNDLIDNEVVVEWPTTEPAPAPRYRYTAIAYRREDNDLWFATIDGHGRTHDVQRDRLEDVARQQVADHLQVPPERIEIAFYSWYAAGNDTTNWRDHWDGAGSVEHTAYRRIIAGATYAEAFRELADWLAPLEHQEHNFTLLHITPQRYPGQPDGHAPVEIEIIYDRELPLEGPEALVDGVAAARTVAAVLNDRNVPACVDDASTPDNAVVRVAGRDDYSFVIDTTMSSGAGWSTVYRDADGVCGEIDSPLDHVDTRSDASVVADAIQQQLDTSPPDQQGSSAT